MSDKRIRVGCHDKAAFASKRNAVAAAKRVSRIGSAGGPTAAYHCSLCSRWHIGGTSDKGDVQRTKHYKRRRRELEGEVN